MNEIKCCHNPVTLLSKSLLQPLCSICFLAFTQIPLQTSYTSYASNSIRPVFLQSTLLKIHQSKPNSTVSTTSLCSSFLTYTSLAPPRHKLSVNKNFLYMHILYSPEFTHLSPYSLIPLRFFTTPFLQTVKRFPSSSTLSFNGYSPNQETTF
jgi:hypothetical protein